MAKIYTSRYREIYSKVFIEAPDILTAFAILLYKVSKESKYGEEIKETNRVHIEEVQNTESISRALFKQ